MCVIEAVLMHLIITQHSAFRPWEDKEESAVQRMGKKRGGEVEGKEEMKKGKRV